MGTLDIESEPVVCGRGGAGVQARLKSRTRTKTIPAVTAGTREACLSTGGPADYSQPHGPATAICVNLWLIHHAFDLNPRPAEVDEQAHLQAGRFEVVDTLAQMDIVELAHRLQPSSGPSFSVSSVPSVAKIPQDVVSHEWCARHTLRDGSTAIVAVPEGRCDRIQRRLRISGRKPLCGMGLPSVPPDAKRVLRWHGVCCSKN